MKITISGFIFIAVFIVIVDSLGLWVWKRELEESNDKKYNWLRLILLGIVPAIEILSYFFFAQQIRSADSYSFTCGL